MGRLLLIIAVAAIAYMLIKSFRKGISETKGRASPQDMVRCSYCGVYLPKNEGVVSGELLYCSDAHRRLHQALLKNSNAG
jgi:uncharacterized protein